MTRHEAREYLKIDLRTLDKLIREGRVPVAYVGRHIRIRRDDLHDLFTVKQEAA
uniref:Helix-turn-helix domain-containing protein n=1 Tax=uncultured prokaryote TaxID=198431 RepID=A0A0H5PYF0_9ZZZZ|nr:hypothetical protein [uncultured prokaryote]